MANNLLIYLQFHYATVWSCKDRDYCTSFPNQKIIVAIQLNAYTASWLITDQYPKARRYIPTVIDIHIKETIPLDPVIYFLSYLLSGVTLLYL